MGKNKMGLQFKGFDEIIENLDKAGGDLKRVTEAALKASKAAVNPGIGSAGAKHHRTGHMNASIDKNMHVEWDGNEASIDVGFDLGGGGLPSIFLMYGTPRVRPDKTMYNSIYSTKVKKQVAEIQEEAINKAIKRSLGG